MSQLLIRDSLARPPSAGLPRRYAWLLALATPVLLAPLWTMGMGQFPQTQGAANPIALILFLLLAVCTWTDLRGGKIFNWATYSAFFWALLLNGIAFLFPTQAAAGVVGLGQCLAGAIVCFSIMFFIYRLAGGGAGDVKLATALGALLGLERGLNALVFSYLFAGVAIVCWVIWTIGPLILLKSCVRKAGSLLFPLWIMPPTTEQNALLKRPVPLAVFFASGTLAAVLGGPMMP